MDHAICAAGIRRRRLKLAANAPARSVVIAEAAEARRSGREQHHSGGLRPAERAAYRGVEIVADLRRDE